MALAPGTRLGAYEVLMLVGTGGMGEVYRARDTKLRREVALKILPEVFAVDPDRLARFQREAELLAALNHPNIAAIYGIEQSGATNAIVMELVDGEALDTRLKAGRAEREGLGGARGLPLDEALPVARQIVDALEAAHDRGVVHRDLKPANIKVTPDGKVKLLDFGLAKMAEADAKVAGLSMSPTLSVHATYAGVILGTAAYMSPEQARGKPVDRRTDIWAFGCVLYEMMTGKQAFDGGETVSDAIAAILTGEVDWAALPPETPRHVRSLLRRCLQKDPQKRLPHIGVARLDLDEADRTERVELPAGATKSRVRERIMWGAAVVLSAVVATAARWAVVRPTDAPEMRVDINVPATTDVVSFALSPDARAIVFVSGGPGGSQLWLRRLDSPLPRPLPGTEGAQFPFWSPDGRSVGFFSSNKLRRVELEGGTPQALANVITPAGGTWSRNGTILFVPNSAANILRVSAGGGVANPVFHADRPRESAQRFPQFLPDDRHFLFYVPGGASEAAGVYVGDVERPEARFLTPADGAALYAAEYLFFVRQGTLLAQPFNPRSLELTGTSTRVADDVTVGASAVAASASSTGVIAYRTGGAQRLRKLTWFDRSGKELGGATDDRTLTLASNPSLSADGRTVAMQASTQQNTDVWLLDVERKVSTRFTNQPGIDALPIWSPDGRAILFSSYRRDTQGLFVKPISGDTEEQVLRGQGGEVYTACDWSPDGRFVLTRSVDPGAGTYDLLALPLQGDRKAFPVVKTPFDERDGQFSPDGKWVAYQSDESGKPEIYVQPFPGPGTKTRISADGGTQVRWRHDGSELFYIAGDNRLIAVPITLSPNGPIQVGSPAALFRTRILGLTGILRQQYVVSPDGQRFLINVVADDASTSPISLLLNWKPLAQ